MAISERAAKMILEDDKEEDKKEEGAEKSSGKKDDKSSKKKDTAEPKELFSIDGGVLIAKLHLAAKTQTVDQQLVFIKNAGVLNEKLKDVPDKETECKFSFKDGPQYEVGFFLECKDMKLPYEQYFEDYKQKVTQNQKIDDDKIKEIEEGLEKENEERKKALEQTKDKLKKKVLTLAKTYFTVFIGKNNATKLNASSISDPIPWEQIKSDDSSFSKIQAEKGKIKQPDPKTLEKMVEEERQQFEEEAKTKTSNLMDKPPERYYCFKVMYTTQKS